MKRKSIAPKKLKRPVYCRELLLSPQDEIELHAHNYHQLIYASNGIMRIITENGAWVVPPTRGIWVPAKTQHSIFAISQLRITTVYVSLRKQTHLPNHCCIIIVNNLMRELILKGINYGMNYPLYGAQSRLLQVIIDQLQPYSDIAIYLPNLTDQRLQKIETILQNDPSNNQTLDALGKVIGASSRTLSRLFNKEANCSFISWRTQFRLTKALELLADGTDITTTAHAVGYQGASLFIQVFKDHFGETPKQYFRAY